VSRRKRVVAGSHPGAKFLYAVGGVVPITSLLKVEDAVRGQSASLFYTSSQTCTSDGWKGWLERWMEGRELGHLRIG
jgi:hypothetical protein